MRDTEQEGFFRDNTFRIRLAIAGILVLLVVIFDISDTVFMGISTKQIYDTIAMDYGADMKAIFEKSTPNES